MTQRRGIQSIEIGFTILDALSKERSSMPLKLLADSVDMTPSKAHLYLVSFQRLGLVTQDRITGHYGLGPAAIHLGVSAINQLDVIDVARRILPEIADSTNCSFSLAIWGNRGPTIIHRVNRNLPVPLRARVGNVIPLLTTATGRMFMAHLPEEEWAEMASTEEPMNVNYVKEVKARLPGIRSKRSETTVSEWQKNYFGVCSPVFSVDNSVAATITAVGLLRENAEKLDEFLENPVRDAARKISETLGATCWSDDA